MADGSIEFSTRLDNSDLEKQLRDATKKVEALKKKIETETANRSAIEKEMDRAQQAIERTSAETEKLRVRLKELRNVDPTDQSAWFAAQREVDGLTTRLAEAERREASLAADKEKLDVKWQKATDKINEYNEQLGHAQNRQRRLGEEYAKTYGKAGSSVAAGMERARNAMDGFTSRINTMLKKVFVFGIILKAIRSVKAALGTALQGNEQFSASWENLKATIQGVANAIASFLAPAIIGMVNGATAAINALARAVDSIFGTNVMQTIQQARAAAEGNWRQTDASKEAQEAAQKAAEKAAKATQKQARASKDLAKQTDKAARSIMGFDELNVLNAEDMQDAADAIEDMPDDMGEELIDPSTLMKPDWNALDVGKISDKLAEIMLILGAALMAVGAILCFSGINIPLGITLMAIGALMVYAAYQEQWDKLPQEVRDAINAALVITGIVLVVLGAVLCFSGVNVPLGIGMMVAGALLLWTAVALNWQSMPTEIQNVVTVLMGILSVALLVIGAILVLSGGNVPLGVALMVVGALSLAAVVAINWDRMPQEVQTVVTAIMAVLGTALLAVGAILALTGANIPLGVGLMLIGAVSLGAAAALNWGYLSNNVGAAVAIIETLLGTALLVVGGVLAFSGANIPLGIALMAAGALALGHGMTLNWNALPQDVRNAIAVVESIVAPALLVIGAVLTFSGVNIPLGLALLAGGALMLAHLATLDWNAMPEGVRNTVTTILTIVGGALIALGIVLCVTGVGIPLGIAMIVAGAASLVTAAAINWNFLQEKIAEIWAGIVNFWRSNIAPIFTGQWWQNLFKSIVNGLIWAVNSGLNAFGGFVNWIGNGVKGILNSFGISGSGWKITMPQIPYLAQGAVIPPNREFMAVLGDQTRGNNIETPESLMRQVVREEAGRLVADAILAMGGTGNGGSDGADGGGDIVIQVDSETIARIVNRGNASLARRGELGTSVTFV